MIIFITNYLSIFSSMFHTGPHSENFLKVWNKSLNLSKMTISEMIREALQNLRKIVVKDDTAFTAEEISIAYVGKDSPLLFLDSQTVSAFLNDGDYSAVDEVVYED
jgi:hypothetical protein